MKANDLKSRIVSSLAENGAQALPELARRFRTKSPKLSRLLVQLKKAGKVADYPGGKWAAKVRAKTPPEAEASSANKTTSVEPAPSSAPRGLLSDLLAELAGSDLPVEARAATARFLTGSTYLN